MTIHCSERSSILCRLLGGILFTTLPPRQQFFIALLVRRRRGRLS
jgi:hypothetical protein